MAKEKASSTTKAAPSSKASSDGALWRDLLNVEIYKRSQGKWARQVTGYVIALTVLLGVWRLSQFWMGSSATYRFLIPMILGAAGIWLSYRAVNVPKFADFLIATEAEMRKVSWPTRGELIRGSAVVLITIFVLAGVLFFFDIFWQQCLTWLGVLAPTTPGS